MIGKFLDWLVWDPHTRYPRPGAGDPWSARERLGRKVRPLCNVIGHDPQGPLRPLWATDGTILIPPKYPRTADYSGYDYKHSDGTIEHVAGCINPYSGIVYFMRECSRCKYRCTESEKSRANKEAKVA